LSYIGAKPLIAEYYYDSFSGNGVLDSFVTTIEPGSPVSAIVVIDGAVISPEDYYFDGTYIKFATPPASGTNNIQIRYLAIPASGIAAPKTFRQVAEYYATAGQTNFPVQRYDLGYVDVYVNGVQLGNLDYQASDGANIILQVPARENDFVRIVTAYNTLLARQVINATPNSVLVGNGLNPLKEVTPGAANNILMYSAANGNTWISQSSVFNYAGYVSGNIIPTSANAYYIGSNSRPFHSIYVGPGSVHIGNAKLSTVDGNLRLDNASLEIDDLVVSGNLQVLGTTTEIQTTQITANDTLLYLGANNYVSDIYDIGFIGNYNDGLNRHAGVFRKHGTSDFYLFYNYTPEVDSNNTIDINHASFRSANLNVKNIFATGNIYSNGVDISNVTSQLVAGNTPPTTVVTYVNSAITTALADVPEPLGANSAVRLSDLVSLPSDLFINVLGSLDIQLTATNALDGSVTQAGAPSYIYNQGNASITGQANTIGQNYSVINSTYNTTGGGGYRAIITMRIDVANAAGLSNTRYIAGRVENEANTRPDWKGNYDFQAFSALFKIYEINFWDYPWLSGSSPGSSTKGTGATMAFYVNMTPVTTEYTSVYWGHYNIECNVYAVATYHNANIGARWFGLATKKRNLYLNLSYNP
jgi:hypothetical protein